MADCIFCGIAGKTVPAEVVFEDDQVVAFPDIKPQAPIHLLVIPKEHIPSIDHAKTGQAELIGQVLLAAAKLGRERTSGDYRLSVNAGRNVEVDHLHVHLTGDTPSSRGGDSN